MELEIPNEQLLDKNPELVIERNMVRAHPQQFLNVGRFVQLIIHDLWRRYQKPSVSLPSVYVMGS